MIQMRPSVPGKKMGFAVGVLCGLRISSSKQQLNEFQCFCQGNVVVSFKAPDGGCLLLLARIGGIFQNVVLPQYIIYTVGFQSSPLRHLGFVLLVTGLQKNIPREVLSYFPQQNVSRQ